jgi:hypothetical protein
LGERRDDSRAVLDAFARLNAFETPGALMRVQTSFRPSEATRNHLAACVALSKTSTTSPSSAIVMADEPDARSCYANWRCDVARAVGEATGRAHYARGEAADIYPTILELTGSPARDVLRFARDYADAFRGSVSPKTP